MNKITWKQIQNWYRKNYYMGTHYLLTGKIIKKPKRDIEQDLRNYSEFWYQIWKFGFYQEIDRNGCGTCTVLSGKPIVKLLKDLE